MNKHKTIRIIGGSLKNSKIRVAEDIIKPTTDRIRVTLFNWLQVDIREMKVLDLFAGSGVLGLEAMSRGSKYVTFIENSKKANIALSLQLKKFEIKNSENIHIDAIEFLSFQNIKTAYDLIFLDPPYGVYPINKILNLLFTNNWISKSGYIYYESNKPLESELDTSLWNIYRESKAGKVYYYLLSNKNHYKVM